jgi:uncharacterized membrane protein YfcA
MACLSWGVFVGIIFSTIGAAGGILTSFGLITLFGVLEPNSVKPMTQFIVLATVVTLVPGYLRRSALVLSLGLLLGAGGLIGAYVGSTLSSLYLSDMMTFLPLFGALALAIAAQITWKLFQHRKNAGNSSAPRDDNGVAMVSQTAISFQAVSFSYGETAYHVAIWSPLVAGAIISMTASVFGVGGGFLLVPYMSAVLGMPMHIIPATAAIAIFMSLVVSISNFLALGAPIQVDILIPLGIGTVLGAIAGPQINRTLKNTWLQALLALIVTGIGLKYVLF